MFTPVIVQLRVTDVEVTLVTDRLIERLDGLKVGGKKGGKKGGKNGGAK